MTENLSGTVQTVLGPIPPEQLGVTLTHEHLLIDLGTIMTPPANASALDFFSKPVTVEMLSEIRHYGRLNADNAQLFDVQTAIDEIALFRQHGGDSIVDATSIGIARDPVALVRISRASNVNIIMGSSHYVAAAHPADMNARSEDDIVRQIVGDVTLGADGTRVKAGIIGEVGCSWPLADNERKVLRASARAQRLTGAPVLIHPGRNESSPMEIIEVLAEAGADLDRTIMGHLDRTVFQHEILARIAEAGCYLEWDLFGRESSYYTLNPGVDMPGDAKRIDDIAWIASQGYGNKIVISHDMASKDRLTKYGGHGYHYILANIVPRMRARGFTDEAVGNILINNPREALTFTTPG